VQKTARQKQGEVQTDMPQEFNYFTQCKKKHVKNSSKSRSAAAFQRHIICLIPINGLKMRSKIRFTFLYE
jgi:hypothetical protein